MLKKITLYILVLSSLNNLNATTNEKLMIIKNQELIINNFINESKQMLYLLKDFNLNTFKENEKKMIFIKNLSDNTILLNELKLLSRNNDYKYKEIINDINIQMISISKFVYSIYDIENLNNKKYKEILIEHSNKIFKNTINIYKKIDYLLRNSTKKDKKILNKYKNDIGHVIDLLNRVSSMIYIS